MIPYIVKGSVASGEAAGELIRVDEPEVEDTFVRVTGPFAVEGTIPTPVDWDDDGIEDSGSGQGEHALEPDLSACAGCPTSGSTR